MVGSCFLLSLLFLPVSSRKDWYQYSKHTIITNADFSSIFWPTLVAEWLVMSFAFLVVAAILKSRSSHTE